MRRCVFGTGGNRTAGMKQGNRDMKDGQENGNLHDDDDDAIVVIMGADVP